MGYFKTLTIDPSAAHEYSRRWAQNDQVGGEVIPHLASSRDVHPTTPTTVTQPVNVERRAQSDQVERRIKTSTWSGVNGGRIPLTATTIAQSVNITREHVGRSLREWRRNVEHNPRDLNAVNRAALNLEASPWYFTQAGELVITSASDSRKRYHVDLDGCDCRAAAVGKACWHVAAYKILHTAECMRRLEAAQQSESPAHNPHRSRAVRRPQDETCTADAILALVDELL